MKTMEMKADKLLAMGMKKLCVGMVNTSVQTTCVFFYAQPKEPQLVKCIDKSKL